MRFTLVVRERRRVATLESDSSIREVYEDKKEGVDWAYDNTWSYNGCCTEPGRKTETCCIWECAKAIATPATG